MKHLRLYVQLGIFLTVIYRTYNHKRKGYIMEEKKERKRTLGYYLGELLGITVTACIIVLLMTITAAAIKLLLF